MPTLQEFSHYQPSWDGHDFTKSEFASLMDRLSKKNESEVLMADDHSIRLAGTVMRLWQTIKGWLGFENKTDPIKVNYELLKLLRYGESHHFFEDYQIKSLVVKFQEVLKKNEQFTTIAAIIDKILPIADSVKASTLVDTEITAYFTNHRDDLHEAFWPNLFHKYIAPFKTDMATIHFNKGRSQIKAGEYADAIDSLDRALEMRPDKTDWNLALATAQLALADEKCRLEGELALRPYQNVVDTVAEIRASEDAADYDSDCNELEKKANLARFALMIKSRDIIEAVAFVPEKEIEKFILDYRSFLDEFPLAKTNDLELANFYLALARGFSDSSDHLLAAKRELEALPFNSENDQILKEYILAVSMMIIRHHLASDNPGLAFQEASDAWNTLQSIPKTSPKPMLSEIKQTYQQLYENASIKEDPRKAAMTLFALKELSINDPEATAAYSLALSNVYTVLGEERVVLDEIRDAYDAIQTEELRQRLWTIAKTQIEAAIAKKNNAEATNLLETFITTYFSTKSEGMHLLADSYQRIGNVKEAKKWAKQLIAVFADDIESYLAAAKIAAQQNDQDSLHKIARDAVKIFPDDPRAQAMLFDLTGKVEKKDTAQKIKASLAIAEQRPNDWRIQLQLGDLYLESNELEKSQTHFAKAAEQNPNNADIFAGLGQVALSQKRYPEAIDHFKNAAGIAQSNKKYVEQLFKCYKGLALVEREKRDYPSMVANYAEAMAIYPAGVTEVVKLLTSLGLTLYGYDRPNALECFRTAYSHMQPEMVAKKDYIDICLALAEDNIGVQVYSGAIANLEAARKEEPKDLRILQHLATCYQATMKIPEAEQVLKELLELGDTSEQTYRGLGEIYKNQGHYQLALGLFRNAVSKAIDSNAYQHQIYECLAGMASQLGIATKKPEEKTTTNYAPYMVALGKQLIAVKQSALAIECFLEGINIFQTIGGLKKPQALEAYSILGRSRAQQGDFQEASSWYQKALSLEPGNAYLLAEMASVDFALGKLDRAREGYTRAFNLTNEIAYQQKLQAIEEVEEGNIYAQRGIFDLERVRKEVRELVNFATSGPYAEKIRNSLGTWIGGYSTDNMKLSALGKNAGKPDLVYSDGREVCSLLEKAYDNGPGHMASTEMPKDLRKKIEHIRQLTDNLDTYYTRIKTLTEAVLRFAGSTVLAPAVRQFHDPLMQQQFKGYLGIVNQSKQVYKTITDEANKQNLKLPREIIQNFEELNRAWSPNYWIYNAIDHYTVAIDLDPNSYGPHCNQLIDCLLKIGDTVKAIAVYEKFKAAFPKAPIHMDPKHYLEVAQNREKWSKMSNAERYNVFFQAGRIYEDNGKFPEAIAYYKKCFTEADQTQLPALANVVLNFGDKLLNLKDYTQALDVYELLIGHVAKIQLTKEGASQLWGNAAKAAKHLKSPKALTYFEKAMQLDPKEASFPGDLGEIYAADRNYERALTFFSQAYTLDPQNPNRLKDLFQAEVHVGDQYFFRALQENTLQALKRLVAKATTEEPYKTNIGNALSSRLGWLLSEMRQLSLLGQNAQRHDEILEQSSRAIRLIETAYDGKGNHLKPEQLGEDLSLLLNDLNSKETAMRKALQHISPQTVPLTNLSQDTQPLFRQAVDHYIKARELIPGNFGEHVARLISAYGYLGDYTNALKVKVKSESELPEGAPVNVDAKIYVLQAESLVQQKKYKEAIDLLKGCLNQLPQDKTLQKALSHTYYLSAKFALEKNSPPLAFAAFKKAINCGVDAEPACYAALSDLYMTACKNKTSLETGQPINQNAYLNEAINNMKKAADTDIRNPVYAYELGRLAYFTVVPVPFDPVDYLKRSLTIDPDNISYAYGLMMTLGQKYGTDNPEYKKAQVYFIEDVGGDRKTDYWEDPFES